MHLYINKAALAHHMPMEAMVLDAADLALVQDALDGVLERTKESMTDCLTIEIRARVKYLRERLSAFVKE